MKYKRVACVGFNCRKHRQLLWMLNAIAKARGEEVAVTAQRLMMKAGTEELDELGITSMSGA